MAALLVLAVAFVLAGCRDTDVLTEKIIDPPGVSEIDYSLDPVRTDNPQEEPDKVGQYLGEDSDREKDETESSPDYDESPTTNSQTHAQRADAYADEDSKATEGGTSSSPAGDSLSGSNGGANEGIADERGDGDDDGTSQDGEGDDQPQGQEITLDETQNQADEPLPESGSENDQGGGGDPQNTWNPGSGNEGGGKGDDKGATYNDGTYEQLPQNTTKIAAAGPYATIVQSIGGKGALAAAPQKWLDDLPAQAYGNQSELTDVVGISSWGDGTSMDDATIQAIIASGADAVLTSNSYGGVATDAQAKALNDAGVSVVVMPTIGVVDALDADIQTSVQVVGELLKDAGTSIQLDSKRAAQEWQRQHDSAIQTTLQKNGGYTTLLQEGVSEDVVYQGIYSTQPAVPTSSTRYYTSYVDSWGAAKVTTVPIAHPDEFTEARDLPLGGSTREAYGVRVFPQDVWAKGESGWDRSRDLNVDISDGMGFYIAKSSSDPTSKYALIDYYLQCSGACDIAMHEHYTSAGVGDEENRIGSLFEIPNHIVHGYLVGGSSYRRAWTITSSSVISLSDLRYPGGEQYPLMLVRTKAIAQNVQSSANRINKESQTFGEYNFGSPYRVAVVPSGIAGSWVDSSFESFLFAPWAFCLFQESSLAYSDAYVSDFYTAFYRCPASGVLDGAGNWGSDSTAGASCGGYGYEVEAQCPRE